MAKYANLLATIAANIYQNNNNEVTADMVKAAMNAAVASLGAGYQFMGVATPATTPGNTDVKQFYIASGPGTYTNFLDSNSDPIEVNEGEVAILTYDTAWSKEDTGIDISSIQDWLRLNVPVPLSLAGGDFSYGFINTNSDILDLDNPSAPTSWSHAIINCSPGDYFLVNVLGQVPSARGWVFTDSSNRKITQAESDDIQNVVVVAPAGAVKLVLNNRLTAQDRVSYQGLNFVQETDFRVEQFVEIYNQISKLWKAEQVEISDANGDYIAGFIYTNKPTIDTSTPIAPTSGWKHAVLNCQHGDYFIVNSVSNTNSVSCWAFIDASGNKISQSQSLVVTDEVIVAPIGATKLLINRQSGQPDFISYKGINFFEYLKSSSDALNSRFDDDATGWIDFTVKVNQNIPDLTITTDTTNDNETTMVDVECILKLPYNYTKTGKPCKLLMICHGAGDPVSFWKGYLFYNNLVQKFVDAGYAVFDCNGYSNESNGYNFWGCPRGVEGYYKAYDYIIKNYNVEHDFSIYGFSMGGLTAIGLAARMKPNVKCIGLSAPITDLYDAWQITSRHPAIAAAYGFDDPDVYEVEKTIGCNPTAGIVTIGGEEYLFDIKTPMKIWFGTADSAASITCAQRLAAAIQKANGIANFRIVTGAGHEICYANDNVNTELLYWVNRFN